MCLFTYCSFTQVDTIEPRQSETVTRFTMSSLSARTELHGVRQRFADYRRLHTRSLDTLCPTMFGFNISFRSTLNGPLHAPDSHSHSFAPRKSHRAPHTWVSEYAVSRLPNHLKGSKTDSMGPKKPKQKTKRTDRLDSPILYMNFGSPPLFIRAGHT